MKRKDFDHPGRSTERQIARQESTIPTIAKREFRKAYDSAFESGAEVLVAKGENLVRVTKGSVDVVVRRLDGTAGSLRRGTRLDITKRK